MLNHLKLQIVNSSSVDKTFSIHTQPSHFNQTRTMSLFQVFLAVEIVLLLSNAMLVLYNFTDIKRIYFKYESFKITGQGILTYFRLPILECPGHEKHRPSTRQSTHCHFSTHTSHNLPGTHTPIPHHNNLRMGMTSCHARA